MTYGHLWADCLYTGISSGPNARYRVWKAFYLFTYFLLKWYNGERNTGHTYVRRELVRVLGLLLNWRRALAFAA